MKRKSEAGVARKTTYEFETLKKLRENSCFELLQYLITNKRKLRKNKLYNLKRKISNIDIVLQIIVILSLVFYRRLD